MDQSRRRVLQAAGLAGLGSLTGCTAPTRAQAGIDVRGAMYLPARAFNTYQLWKDYDESVIERDMGYAASLNLNSLRTWLSYEFWQQEPENLERRIDHFLRTARKHGIKPVLGIFEALGKEPTEANLRKNDPLSAPPIQTPSSAVMEDPTRWEGPREFIRWVMDRHAGDDRLLAIELINEPGWWATKRRFTVEMWKTLAERRGSVPLTIGATSLSNSAEYLSRGCDLDVIQFHYNFPPSRETYRDALQQGVDVDESLQKPVWLTEWQRVHPGGQMPESEISAEDWQPNYSSLAPVVRATGLGNFFWSLMVKPAYSLYKRNLGILNGLFHEDGAVWSMDDARAIKAMSGTEEFEAPVRQEWPEWASEVKERADRRYQ